jgi:Leucine-rich repeat (LRR) protein
MLNWLLSNETALIYLDLSNNSLVGSLGPAWQRQTNLQLVNISLNHVEGQLPANISLMFPNLTVLDVSHNIISGTIPPLLCNTSIQYMDLSNNKFTGDVPSCLFTDCYRLNILKLSNNSLGGKILDGASSFSSDLWAVYLDNNRFEGTLPRNISGNVSVMDLHNNKMSGELDTSLWNFPLLEALNLASTGLTGDIRPGICTLTSLRMLDLSDNHFTGRIPNCDITLPLSFLTVSGNSLSGNPNAIFNSSYIAVLDISHNQFTGNLQWTQYLYQINVLLLSRNNFEGQMSSNLCHLQHLSIIDMSHNILSGSIPPCIGGIPFEYPDGYKYEWPTAGGHSYGWGFDAKDLFYNSHYDLQGFTFTTKGNPYTFGRNFFMSMSGIDFSANMLSGDIPKEIGNLSHIKSLNLSNNLFTGSIPATFANLSEIESLDLSENRLNGSIPWELTRLSSLGVFSVAFNNLSGCLLDSGQFGSFDMDSYKGNDNLISCTSSSGPVAWNGTVGNVADDSDPIMFVVSAVSFVLAFWATVTFVFCHSFGQRVILKL